MGENFCSKIKIKKFASIKIEGEGRKGEDFSIIMEGCRKNVLKYDVLLFNFVPPIKPSFHNFYFMLLLLPFLSIDNDDDASKTYWCSWIINLHAYYVLEDKNMRIFAFHVRFQVFFFIIESIEIVRKLCENCNEIFLHRLRRLLCPLNEIYFLQSTVHFRKRSVKLCLCHASFDKENSIYFSDSSGNFFFFFFFLKRFF